MYTISNVTNKQYHKKVSKRTKTKPNSDYLFLFFCTNEKKTINNFLDLADWSEIIFTFRCCMWFRITIYFSPLLIEHYWFYTKTIALWIRLTFANHILCFVLCMIRTVSSPFMCTTSMHISDHVQKCKMLIKKILKILTFSFTVNAWSDVEIEN